MDEKYFFIHSTTIRKMTVPKKTYTKECCFYYFHRSKYGHGHLCKCFPSNTRTPHGLAFQHYSRLHDFSNSDNSSSDNSNYLKKIFERLYPNK